MTQPAAEPLPWIALTAGAAACLLAAVAVPDARVGLAVNAAALGLGALAAYGRAQVAAGRPCAAIAWMAAGCVAGVLAWGLGEQHYLFGFAIAGLQLLIGVLLLPSHLRRSVRSR